jgi:predicted AlkP superfamily phosphohydrolase/phosphomutase
LYFVYDTLISLAFKKLREIKDIKEKQMRKVVVIGIDSLLPKIMERFVKEGALPNIGGLLSNGSYSRVIPELPALTSTNWATIATGAEPRTHGVSCYFLHERGNAPYQLTSAFHSGKCKAEKIWQTAERLGKRPIIIDFPSSYPVELKEGIHVGEYGCPSHSVKEVTFSRCYTTEKLNFADRIEPETATNWKNVPDSIGEMLEFKLVIPPMQWEIGHPHVSPRPKSKNFQYDVAIFAADKMGFDTMRICRSKSFTDCVAEIRQGVWSDFITEDFHVLGRATEAVFRFKLIELTPNGKTVKLYLSEVYPTHGYTYPDKLAKALKQECGPYLPLGYNKTPVVENWIDMDTFKEETDYTADWMANCVSYLTKTEPWDLVMLKWHSPDHVKHAFWNKIDPLRHDFDPSKAEEGWDIFRWNYQSVDRLVGRIVDSVGDEVSVVIVSDHGHIAHLYSIMMNDALAQAGLLSWKGNGEIDWSHTKAYAQNLMYIYVNMKGREPTGIVGPSDVEKVQTQIITTLLDLKDPRTGTHPVVLALTDKDADALGVGGNTVGDVVYAMQPGYGSVDNRKSLGEVFPDPETEPPAVWGVSHHGQNIGDAELSVGAIKAVFIARGPGIKKGFYKESPIRMIDVAPTLSEMLGIPAPRDSQGAIVLDFFE